MSIHRFWGGMGPPLYTSLLALRCGVFSVSFPRVPCLRCLLVSIHKELREQLLARASHVEELELLKRDLEQQQQQERSRHESELEQLRLYFEEKLREAERSYQEDLTLLQRRLQEGRDDSLLEAMGTR